MCNVKVLPKGTSVKGQLSIPRAELCTTDELVQQVMETENQIDIPDLHPTQYFSDSRDVLAWINNTEDEFPRYIMAQWNRICNQSSLAQWHYIPTD